ncbi:hypothetical protein Cch01nite_16330 [Cellulomonas chitinilytica]|uniref:Uncharacterized protein n=1 Tax=Cellulomonas chitinilytica TaxID=398759 RepID=A0A919P4J7_9CELL|nr:hypothetical protein Cch01nite_16330 [Cellulomonas chitinilytica]
MALAALLAAGLSGCTGGDSLTLADLGAQDLAGLNGPTVADTCDKLPEVRGSQGRGCGRGPSTGTVNVPLAPGDYAVVLLCEAPGTYRIEASTPKGAFDPVEVSCSDDDDPAVSARITVPEPGLTQWHDSFDGEGQSVVQLVRVPEED